MEHEIALRKYTPTVRCSKCGSSYPVTIWRENHGCNKENCSSKKATLLAAEELNSVSITDDNNLTFVSQSNDLRVAMICTNLSFVIPLYIGAELSRNKIINGKSEFWTIIFAILLGSFFIVFILSLIIDKGARKRLILNSKTKSIDVQTTIYDSIDSQKKEFRKKDDLVEVLLRVEQYTCEQFAEYVDLCNLEGNGIPSIIFQCDLLCDDQSLIRLFEFDFEQVDWFTKKDPHRDLVSNKDKPYSFLSIIRTAEEIGQTLDIPLRMVYKDSVLKGMKSWTYLDL